MKKMLTFALAFGLSAGLAAAAHADQATGPAPYVPEQSSQLPTQPTQQSAAVDAYNRNINALAVVPITGPYDQADAYTTPSGTPLPGWSQMFDGGEGGAGGD